jgi:hypothetical protein
MQSSATNEDNLATGKVFCGDCQHFRLGKEPMSLGLCEKTLQRTLHVEETRKRVADRQGLPPDTNERNGYAACFPSAPRICSQYLSECQVAETE